MHASCHNKPIRKIGRELEKSEPDSQLAQIHQSGNTYKYITEKRDESGILTKIGV